MNIKLNGKKYRLKTKYFQKMIALLLLVISFIVLMVGDGNCWIFTIILGTYLLLTNKKWVTY